MKSHFYSSFLRVFFADFGMVFGLKLVDGIISFFILSLRVIADSLFFDWNIVFIFLFYFDLSFVDIVFAVDMRFVLFV